MNGVAWTKDPSPMFVRGGSGSHPFTTRVHVGDSEPIIIHASTAGLADYAAAATIRAADLRASNDALVAALRAAVSLLVKADVPFAGTVIRNARAALEGGAS